PSSFNPLLIKFAIFSSSSTTNIRISRLPNIKKIILFINYLSNQVNNDSLVLELFNSVLTVV
ncbi:MAG TPA: hypothetical protein PK426_11610, partial [Spirochaetota bacterium]|nr:hypothetical protein [Spirochaetota bacterium]